MRSAVYQQGSGVSDSQLDPENRLLARMNRRRLDWESLRDSLLAVSGQLDLTQGGPSVKVTTAPFSARRSVYGFIDRQDLPSVLRTFDFAPPDTSNALRHQTTVPQQALFLLNSPFLKEQTRLLAARPDLIRIEPIEERIDAVYRRLFGRTAEAEEIAIGRKFLAAAAKTTSEPAQLNAWEEYLQTLLVSNEFVFVD